MASQQSPYLSLVISQYLFSSHPGKLQAFRKMIFLRTIRFLLVQHVYVKYLWMSTVFTLIWLQFLSCNLGCAVVAVVLPVALDPEAELGRLIEPMLPPLLLLEKPLEEVEEEDLPPSTESSSSKFLSAGNTSNIDQCFIKYVHCCTLNQEDLMPSSICSETAATNDEGLAKVCSWNQLIVVCLKN